MYIENKKKRLRIKKKIEKKKNDKLNQTTSPLVRNNAPNFTVNKPFDCFLKCFHARCRCQAYQIKDGRKCELLDDDKFSVPYHLMEVQGYVYFEFNREYHKAVRKCTLYARKLFSL